MDDDNIYYYYKFFFIFISFGCSLIQIARNLKMY